MFAFSMKTRYLTNFESCSLKLFYPIDTNGKLNYVLKIGKKRNFYEHAKVINFFVQVS